MTETLAMAMAILCQLLAITCLFMVWKQRVQLNSAFNLLGVAMWLLSFGFWIAMAGAEFGITLGFFLVPLLAWCFIVLSRQKEPKKIPKPTARSSVKNSKKSVAKGRTINKLLSYFNGILLAGLVCLIGIAWLVSILPYSEATRLVIALLLLPCVWGGVMTYAFATQKQWRLLAILSILCGLIGLRLFI